MISRTARRPSSLNFMFMSHPKKARILELVLALELDCPRIWLWLARKSHKPKRSRDFRAMGAAQEAALQENWIKAA
jgi:hypothetical protein